MLSIEALDSQFIAVAGARDGSIGKWIQQLTPELRALGRIPHLMLRDRLMAKHIKGEKGRGVGRQAVCEWVQAAQRLAPEMPAYYWTQMYASFFIFMNWPLRELSVHK